MATAGFALRLPRQYKDKDKNEYYIDDLGIDDWSSILRSWWGPEYNNLSISTVYIDDPIIQQPFGHD